MYEGGTDNFESKKIRGCFSTGNLPAPKRKLFSPLIRHIDA